MASGHLVTDPPERDESGTSTIGGPESSTPESGGPESGGPKSGGPAINTVAGESGLENGDSARAGANGDNRGKSAHDAASTPVSWRVIRPLLLRVHFYAGVFIAPFLAVAALTGLLYTAAPQLDQWLYADQLTVPAATGSRPPSQPLSDQVAAARAAVPDGKLDSVRPSATATDTTRVSFAVDGLPDEDYLRTAFIDPRTNKVRGVLNTDGDALPVSAFLDRLHKNLLLGEPGRMYTEVAASWLWVVVLGGLALWIGQRRDVRRRRKANRVAAETAAENSALENPTTDNRAGENPAGGNSGGDNPAGSGVRRRAGGRSRLVRWHGALGLWLVVGLLFLSATGLTWSQYAGANIEVLRGAVGGSTPDITEGIKLPAGAGGDVGVDRVLAAARSVGVTDPVVISPPAKPGEAYIVKQTRTLWPIERDSAAIDPASGRVLKVLRFDEYPLLAQLPTTATNLHMGLLFGLPNQLVLAAIAIGVIVQICWAYRMWWKRRPTRSRSYRPGRPPSRGAWRRVPGRILAPALLAVAIVGYLVPLFGLSLLVFLAVDIALGAWQRRRTRATVESRAEKEIGASG